MQAILNQSVRRDPGYRGLFDAAEYERVEQFYTAHPDLKPTPLRSLPALAARLGLGEVLVKDESRRWGVEAFKIAGVRYAVEQLDTPYAEAGTRLRDSGKPWPRRRPRRSRSWRAMHGVPASRATRCSRHRTRDSRGSSLRHARGPCHGDRNNRFVRGSGRARRRSRRQDGRHGGLGYRMARIRAHSSPDHVRLHTPVRRSRSQLVHATRHRHRSGWCRGSRVCRRELVRVSFRSQPAVSDRVRTRQRRVPARIGESRSISQSDRGSTADAWAANSAANDHGRSALCGAVACGLAFDSRRDRCVRLCFGPTRARGDRHASVRWIHGCGPPRHRRGRSIEAGPSGACGVAAMMALVDDPRAESVRARARLGRSTRAMAIVTEGP